MSNCLAKVSDLTISLLETNPVKYAQTLKDLMTWGNGSHAVKEKLNEKPYETWHSNHLFALSRLVGTLNPDAQDREENPIDTFYGSRNVEGISTKDAITLLKMMLNAGGNITAKDFYDQNLLEYLKDGHMISRFYRTGNEEYTRFVETVFTSEPCNVSDSCEEGIPVVDSCEEGIPPEQ
tara:strand:+ start:801 stop:1337 length:537 start_codon:yes stop_codon:yes gene_type:complete